MSAMISLGSDLKNIVSCEKKKNWLNSAFFPSFYTSGSGSGTGLGIRIHGPKWIRIRIHATDLFFLIQEYMLGVPAYLVILDGILAKKQN